MAIAPPAPQSTEHRAGILAALARTDVWGAQARAAFDEAGVECVLLKGRAFARRLYDQAWERPYADSDILVAFERLGAAVAALQRLGYARIDRDGDRLGLAGYAHSFARGDGAAIDLHWGLSGVGASPERLWSAVGNHTTPMSVGGRDARVPDDALTALLVVLHAAHHGGQHGSTLADLQRACTRIARPAWEQAVALASRLEADEAFAAGLALDPAAQVLGAQLGVSGCQSLEYRLRADETEFRVWALHRLAGARGWTRLRVIAEVVVPPPHLMRRFAPLARRGRWGLAAAYLVRPLRLGARALPALLDYLRARLNGVSRNPPGT